MTILAQIETKRNTPRRSPLLAWQSIIAACGNIPHDWVQVKQVLLETAEGILYPCSAPRKEPT